MSQRGNIRNYSLSQNKNLNIKDNHSKLEKPITSFYNIYVKKQKISKSVNKMPIYSSYSNRQAYKPINDNLFQSPNKLEKKIHFRKIYLNSNRIYSQRNKCSSEYQTNFIPTSKKGNNNTIHQEIYVRKKSVISPAKRCLSESNLNNKNFKSKKKYSYLTLTSNEFSLYKKKENLQKNIQNTSISEKNQNIININLYNEKNNFIANNIINKIYMNKNKRNNTIYGIKTNYSQNSSITNNSESLFNTERKDIPRKSNYSFYYCPKNYQNNNNECFFNKNNSKRKTNYLPIVQRKSNRQYNESSIIKIQSVIRGYLLNKKLDKYLRHFMKINNAIKIIEKIFIKQLIEVLKRNKRNRKNYNFRNIYYSKRNDSINSINKNQNLENNIELQTKINELINEKKELQNNYDNLKEFIKKYKELEKQNQALKNEIEKLKEKNNELLVQLNKNKRPLFNYNLNKYKRYVIQKQKELNIISPKNVDIIYRKYNLNKEIKLCDNKNGFFTLGIDGKENEEIEEKESLKKNELRFLVKNKENQIKFKLFKSFVKFYFNGLCGQKIMNIPINLNNGNSNTFFMNRRYINYDNNLLNCMSIKTLSDNSSIITENKSKILELDNKMVKSNFCVDEYNKKK